MYDFIKSAFESLLARFGWHGHIVQKEDAPEAPKFWFSPEKKRNARTNKRREKILRGEVGAAQYDRKNLKSLLADLDDVFADLDVMTPRGGKSIQGAIKAFGPFIFGRNESEVATISIDTLDGIDAYGYPSVLCNFFPLGFESSKSKHGSDAAKLYFAAVKLKQLPWICRSQRYRSARSRASGGLVYYEAALVCCREGKRPDSFYFYVSVNTRTGEYWPVKMPVPTKRFVGFMEKTQKPQWGERVSWKIPDYRSESALAEDADVETYMKELFAANWNLTVMREYGANIQVRKGKLKATFLVPENQWKYFFSERFGATCSDGRKKAIFHAVVAHSRQTERGESFVRTHYRGERSFFWNGYSIEIVLPGKHKASQSAFDVPAEVMEKGLTYKQTEKRISHLH